MPTQLITEDWIAGMGMAPRRVGQRRIGMGLAPRRVGQRRIGMGLVGEPTLVDQVKTIYQSVVDLDPLIKLVSNHPWITITAAMLVVTGGSFLAGWLGRELKLETKGRKR